MDADQRIEAMVRRLRPQDKIEEVVIETLEKQVVRLTEENKRLQKQVDQYKRGLKTGTAQTSAAK